jgi:hypothetical protein
MTLTERLMHFDLADVISIPLAVLLIYLVADLNTGATLGMIVGNRGVALWNTRRVRS